MITLAITVAMIFIIAGVVLGLAAFGVASLGVLVTVGFKIGVAVIPLIIGLSIAKWAISNI